MHELSICQALLDQLEGLAEQHGAHKISRVALRIGPLSGVESGLLKQAWPLAAAGSVAEGSQLEIEPLPVRVSCLVCDAESEVPANRLLCPLCGDYGTSLVSGDELLLATVDLETED